MTRRPRGNCSVCRGMVAITPSGRIWAHQKFVFDGVLGFVGTLCSGTGRPPRVES